MPPSERGLTARHPDALGGKAGSFSCGTATLTITAADGQTASVTRDYR